MMELSLEGSVKKFWGRKSCDERGGGELTVSCSIHQHQRWEKIVHLRDLYLKPMEIKQTAGDEQNSSQSKHVVTNESKEKRTQWSHSNT